MQLCYSIQPNVCLHNVHLVSLYEIWYRPYCQAAYRTSTGQWGDSLRSTQDSKTVLATHVPDTKACYNKTKVKGADHYAVNQRPEQTLPFERAQAAATPPSRVHMQLRQSYSLHHLVGEVLLCDWLSLSEFSPGDKALIAPHNVVSCPYKKVQLELDITGTRTHIFRYKDRVGLQNHTHIPQGELSA